MISAIGERVGKAKLGGLTISFYKVGVTIILYNNMIVNCFFFEYIYIYIYIYQKAWPWRPGFVGFVKSLDTVNYRFFLSSWMISLIRRNRLSIQINRIFRIV